MKHCALYFGLKFYILYLIFIFLLFCLCIYLFLFLNFLTCHYPYKKKIHLFIFFACRVFLIPNPKSKLTLTLTLTQYLTHFTSSMSLLPSNLVPLHLQTLHHPPNPNRGLPYPIPILPYSRSQTPSIICAKRTGKQRYPSEKKKLKQKQKQTLTLTPVDNKFEGVWRLSKLGVPIHSDPGKDFLGLSPGLLQEIAKVIEFPVMFLFGC